MRHEAPQMSAYVHIHVLVRYALGSGNELKNLTRESQIICERASNEPVESVRTKVTKRIYTIRPLVIERHLHSNFTIFADFYGYVDALCPSLIYVRTTFQPVEPRNFEGRAVSRLVTIP